MKIPEFFGFVLVSLCVGVLTGSAATDEERIKILEARMDEAERLAEQSGASASWHNIQLHGYGELHYNTTTQSGKDDEMDFHRMVLGLSYGFSDSIVFDMEVDFEHAATEMELEFAHVSLLLSDSVNLRIGSMLMPVGGLNETHEPPLFYSVERPYVQKYVIPTSWNEGGIGVFGSIVPELNYRIYLVGGLDASKFTASSGIRKGRGKVAESIANDLAVAGRLEYRSLAGLSIGASGYFGNAGQDNSDLDDTAVSIVEADFRYRVGIIEVQGSVASVGIDDTEMLNALTEEVVGEEILGWNGEVACHVGQGWMPDGQDVVIFARYEEVNTQEEVAAGFEADAANDRQITTVGLAYYPIEQVVIKADVEAWSNEAGDDWTQANLGMGLIY